MLRECCHAASPLSGVVPPDANPCPNRSSKGVSTIPSLAPEITKAFVASGGSDVPPWGFKER